MPISFIAFHLDKFGFEKLSFLLTNCCISHLGGMQFGNTDFTKRLSYGGGGGGGGGSAFTDDTNLGGRGGNGGGLVYLLLEEITLEGKIESKGNKLPDNC